MLGQQNIKTLYDVRTTTKSPNDAFLRTYPRRFIYHRYVILRLSKYFRRYVLLTYSMEQSPSWEANRFAANQEIPRILWNPKVHYLFTSARHLSLFWTSSIQSTSTHLKIRLNIILPLRPDLPCGLFPSGFPNKFLYTPLVSSIRATFPAHLFLDFITRIILGVHYTVWCKIHFTIQTTNQ